MLSPATVRLDRTEKLSIYAEYGISYCWLVDPAVQTLEALSLVDGQWRIASTWSRQDLVRVEPFAEVALELGALWQLGQDSTD